VRENGCLVRDAVSYWQPAVTVEDVWHQLDHLAGTRLSPGCSVPVEAC